MSIFLYARVSSRSSKLSGISIQEQLRLASEYAANNIAESGFFSKSFASDMPGSFVDEAVSGWSRGFLKRPAGWELNKHLQPGDSIITYSIDRMCRNMRDFCNLTAHFEAKQVSVHYIVDGINTSTAAGKLQAHIRAAAAQYSSDLLSERMKEAWAIRKLRAGQPVSKKQTKLRWDNSEWATQVEVASARTYGRVFTYERVSSISQYTSGLSLENQSIANERYAQRHCVATGAVMGETFREDAISAFNTRFDERPEGKRLLSMLRPGDDVVVYRSDRAFRHPGDALEICKLIKSKGAHLHLLVENIRTDQGHGEDWLGVLSSIAHLESTLKSRRVREAHDHCRRTGRPVGQIKKGYKAVVVGGKKKLALDEADVTRCAAVWVARNEMQLSIQQTTDLLVALKCEATGERATLRKYSGHSGVKWHMGYAERLQKELPPTLWSKALDRARARMAQPISQRYWIVPSWMWPGGVLVA